MKNTLLYNYVLRLADDCLIMSHRLASYCSHGPYLEEDLAISNTALDMLGQAEALLTLTGRLENKQRDADDLAYGRYEHEFVNVQLVEIPNVDFAQLIAKQYYVDLHHYFLYEALKTSGNTDLAGLAVKFHKEVTYHIRRSRSWIIRLGLGTDESHLRIQNALNQFYPYTFEWFTDDEVTSEMARSGVAVEPAKIKDLWDNEHAEVLKEGNLTQPIEEANMANGRSGYHTEYMGYLLAEMQSLTRMYPDAKW